MIAGYALCLAWQSLRHPSLAINNPLQTPGHGGIDDLVVQGLCKDQIELVLYTLSEREAAVIKLRFGLVDDEPKTLEEIGKVYGVGRNRIRQIESKAMNRLRHPSRSDSVRDFLD